MKDELLYVYDEQKQCVSVLTFQKKKIYPYSSKKRMEKLCFSYGRDFKENRKFVQRILRVRQKVPLLLDVFERFIMFPVYGMHSTNNIWISYSKIRKIKSLDCNCKIIFVDGSELILPCQKRSIQMQRRRCRKILKLLKEV